MSRTYAIGPVKPWVQSAADEIGSEFNVATIFGWTAVGSTPNSDHPKGLAIDLMVYTNKSKGDAIAAYAVSNAQRLNIKYIIWYRRIWENGNWTAYHGTSNPHIDHVHISFLDTAGDPTQASNVSNGTNGVLGQINLIAQKAQSSDVWHRLGYYALGFFLILIGSIILMRKQIATAAKAVV